MQFLYSDTEDIQALGLQTYSLPKTAWEKVSAAFGRAMTFIHRKGKYEPSDLNSDELRPLISETFSVLSDAVNLGLKDNNVPAAMRLYLLDNTFLFSGFKTHRELEAASRLLLDDNGSVRSFSDFLTQVRKIDKDYNATYLNAEYNFAVSSAQMAAKWQDFVKDGDKFYLQYRTARDERVRSSHRPLDRITLPVDDPFWNEYMPPLGWNCRCQVVQVRRDNHKPSNSSEAVARGIAATTQLDKNGRNKAQIFRFNPGKQKVIFPPKHPYFPKNCGNCKYKKYAYDKDKPECEACKIINTQSFEEIQKYLQSLSYKEKTIFAKDYIKQNKVGKVFFSHPAFGSRKAEFTNNTINEAIRYASTFDIKFDILFNIEEYMNSDSKLTVELPKDNKDHAQQFFVLTTKYKGVNDAFRDKIVQILFRVNQNHTINIHFIRLPQKT